MSLGSNISDQLRHGADALDPKHVASAAKEHGTHAAQVAADAGMDVAHKVGEQAAVVVEQAKEHLASMVSHSPAVRRMGSRLRRASRRLQRAAPARKRGPAAIVGAIIGFARRRPVWFLLIAAAAGVAVVRLVSAGRESATGTTRQPHTAPDPVDAKPANGTVRAGDATRTNGDGRNGTDRADRTGGSATDSDVSDAATEPAGVAGAQPGTKPR